MHSIRGEKHPRIGGAAFEASGRTTVVDELPPALRPAHRDRDGLTGLLGLAIVLLAFAARVYRIFELPPGLNGDEAGNAMDIMRVLEGGYLPLYFEANNGREPLFIYLQAPLVALLGPMPYALRLTSALVGVLTVALAYRWARDLFGTGENPAGRWVPLVTSFLLAASLWHVTLSRIGLRAITLPMLALAAFILVWRAYARQKPAYYLSAGVFMGLSLYTYIASRLLPLLLALFLLGRVLWRQGDARPNWTGFALMSGALAAVASPLAAYAAGHPLIFWGRVVSVSTLDRSAPSTWESVARTLEMFVWTGNEDSIFDPGGRTVFEWPMGLAFLLGLGLCLAILWLRRGGRSGPAWLAPARPQALLLAFLWLGVMITPSFFSYPAPHFLRAAGAIPAAYIFPALAMGLLAGALSGAPSALWKRLGIAALALLTMYAGASDLRDYYRLVGADQSYYDYDGDMYEMAQYIKGRATEETVYGDTQLMLIGSVRVLTRGLPVASFDSRWAVVFPQGPAEYLLLAGDAPARNFERYLPPDAASFMLRDSRGKERVAAYRTDGRAALDYNRTVPSAPLFGTNQPPREPVPGQGASVAGEMALRGYGVTAGGDSRPAPTAVLRPGMPFRTVLAWEVLQKPSLSYHVSVKAFDSAGQAWAQSDSPPGGGGYRTTRWSPGEWVYDIYELALDAAAPPGRYHLEVTVYDVETLRIFPVLSPEGQALAQHYVLGDVEVVDQ